MSNAASLFTPDASRPTDTGVKRPYDVLLIDGGGMVVTAWSTQRDQERAEDRVRSGVYIFLTTLASLSSMIRPGGKIICAWDGEDNRAFRRGMHPWYKHGRGSVINRTEVRTIMSELDSLLEAMGVAQTGIPKHEADDVVATLAKRYSKNGDRVVIFSDDHDYRQLIDDNVHLSRRSMDGIIFSPSQCELNQLTYGERYLHAKAMHGDTGDNIKGLNGIGEKKAYALLDVIPSVIDQMTDDHTSVDWSPIYDDKHKALRNAFIRAGRRLVFPTPIPKENLAFAEKYNRTGKTLNTLEVTEEDALIAASAEIVRCLKLVTMDRDLPVDDVMIPKPNHDKIPAMMARLEMQNETDLYSSLYRLAGVLHPEASPSWRSTVRVGSAVDGGINEEDIF